MVSKRIIPCLDVKNGRVVKGTNFLNLRDAGDPVELGAHYSRTGADELVYLDISATDERRKTLRSLVERVARTVSIPFTVGGGISSVEDVHGLLQSGADKITVNSAAINNPGLINALSARFGSQCIVLSVDAREVEGEWRVYSNGGKKRTGKELFTWIEEAVERGAGEILFTSMDHDGTRMGFAVEALKQITSSISVPVIASGGGGSIQDFVNVFQGANVDAALAASIFHYGTTEIEEIKMTLNRNGIKVRYEEREDQSI